MCHRGRANLLEQAAAVDRVRVAVSPSGSGLGRKPTTETTRTGAPISRWREPARGFGWEMLRRARRGPSRQAGLPARCCLTSRQPQELPLIHSNNLKGRIARALPPQTRPGGALPGLEPSLSWTIRTRVSQRCRSRTVGVAMLVTGFEILAMIEMMTARMAMMAMRLYCWTHRKEAPRQIGSSAP